MEEPIKQLPVEKMNEITQAISIDRLSMDEIIAFFEQDLNLASDRARQSVTYDPRNNEPVIFNPKRAHRPNGYTNEHEASKHQSCPICTGQTTGILDIAELSEGYTFINKNLYPVVTPFHEERSLEQENADHLVNNITGLHFLQWTSSIHDRDWHNMPIEDCEIAMTRLAALEKHLVKSSKTNLEPIDKRQQSSHPSDWSVSIIKNVGDQIGGSLPHGHQQIILSNVLPRRIIENRRFEQEHGETFAAFIQSHSPKELIIKEYEEAVLLVPFFMRRPYDMMLILKDTSRRYCHEMDDTEIRSIAQGWHDATLAISRLMPRINRELAYNVITHNGPGAGLYFEFLPYTQGMGGLEQLGLFSCQGDPYTAAKTLGSLL